MINVDELTVLEQVIGQNVNLTAALANSLTFPRAREKITQIYGSLHAEERKLFLSLISRYRIYPNYFDYIHRLVPRLLDLHALRGSLTLSTPYLAFPKEQKSAGPIAYDIRAIMVGNDVPKRHISLADIVPAKPKPGPIVIVDDFSGSGKTIVDAIDQLLLSGANPSDISVSLLYIMKAAKSDIEGRGVLVDAVIEGDKAITGYAFSDAEGGDGAARTYDGLEARLGVNDENKRGFGGAESLVTMKTTPNNTLPIFWFRGGGKTKWPCPFPR